MAGVKLKGPIRPTGPDTSDSFVDGGGLESYGEWEAKDPTPFLDLFNNIYDYIGFQTGGKSYKWAAPEYTQFDTDVVVGSKRGTMLDGWQKFGNRRPRYKNTNKWKLDYRYPCSTLGGSALHRAEAPFEYMYIQDLCNAHRFGIDDLSSWYPNDLFYGSEWDASQRIVLVNHLESLHEDAGGHFDKLLDGTYLVPDAYNYIFNIADNDALAWDEWPEGLLLTPQEALNNHERDIFSPANIVNTTKYTEADSDEVYFLKRLMTYCKMHEVIERYGDVTNILGPSTEHNDDYPYTPDSSPTKGFMANRTPAKWGFTARSRPHIGHVGPGIGTFTGNDFYFLGQVSDKIQPQTITNKNNNHKSFFQSSSTLETIGNKTNKDQCKIIEQCSIFSAKSNYESFIDFLKILIEELVANLDYGAYVAETNTFDDGHYTGWDLETFASSETFVTKSIVEGIIEQISAPNYPLEISEELATWWYDFAAMSGVAVPDWDDLSLAREKEALGVDSIDLSCAMTCEVELAPVVCPACIPNPKAFTPVWTEETEPFLDEKKCVYSITMLTDFPNAADATLAGTSWEARRQEVATEQIGSAIDTLLEHYNKAPDFFLEAYVDANTSLAAVGGYTGEEVVEKNRDQLPVYSVVDSYTGIPSPDLEKVYYLADSAAQIANYSHSGEAITDGLSIYPLEQDPSGVGAIDCPNTSKLALFRLDSKDMLLNALNFAYVDDYELKGAPISSRMKVLISVPAEIFDKIPEAEPRDTTDVQEEAPGPPYVVFELIPRVKKGNRSQDFRVMVRQAAAGLGHYAQQYAAYVHTNPADAFGYADLDLREEAKHLREFKVAINDLFLSNGLNFRKVEKFRINFEDEEGGFRPYTVKSVQIYDCDDKRIKLRSGFGSFKKSDSVNRIRTMAYVANLPSMANDLTAREAMPWQEFLEKYTYPFSLNFGSSDPQSTIGCAFESLIEDPLEGLVNGIANEILSFPDALGYAFNQRLCNDPCERNDLETELRDIEGMMQRAMRASFLDHFAGDSVMQFLPELLAGNADGIKGLWKEVLDKHKWCGLIWLLQSALECLQAGLNPDEIFRILVKQALEAVGPVQLEKIFIGLPPDKQMEVKNAVAAEFGNIPPPWDQGYRAGSYSGGGARYGAESDYFSNLEGRVDESGNETEYVPKTTGVGTIGNASDGALDAIMTAYVGGIWEVFGEGGLDELYDMLQGVPGGEIIAKIIQLSECAFPPLFTPPLSDFLKTLELDFCAPSVAITLPKFNQFPNFADIWRIFTEVLMEVLQWLLVKIIMMIFKTLFDILFGLLCALLEAAGAALNAAITGNNLQDLLKDTFCGLGASEEAVNAAAAELVSALTLDPTCPQPSDNDVAMLFEDISVTLTQDQLIDLLEGTDSIYAAKIIFEMIQTQPDRLGVFVCVFPTAMAIAEYFRAMGHLVPPDYMTRPQMPDTPLNVGLCGDPEARLLQEEYQRNLLLAKGTPSEYCDELIEKLRCKNLSTLEDLTKVIQNGIEDLLPPIYASPGCDAGANAILPDSYGTDFMPPAIAMGSVADNLFSGLAKKHNRDLLVGDGFLNMVLSDRHGRGLRGHNNLVNFMANIRPLLDADGTLTDRNLFPPTVAEHLRTRLEDYGKGTGAGGITFNSFEQEDNFWLTKETRSFRKKAVWDADAEEFTYGSVDRKIPDLVLKFEDYKVDKEVSKYDAPYAFRLMYSHWVINADGEAEFTNPVDKYRLRLEEDVWEPGQSDAGDISDFTTTNDTLDVLLDVEGEAFIPADAFDFIKLDSDTESLAERDTFTDGPEYAIGGLKVGDFLTKDPHSVTFSKLIRKRIEDNWTPGYAITSPGDPLPSDALDAFETMLKNKIYPKLVGNMLNRSAHVLSKNSRAFTFGYNEENDNPDLNYLIDPFPETYGGTVKRPRFYVEPPKRDGWLGILDALVPPEDACPPDDEGLGLWDSVSDSVDECTQKFLEDERLRKDPNCFIEMPFDRLFARGSSAMIEGVIIATIRIHILEVFLKGMPNFSILKPSFPDLYDDLLATGIVESILDDLLEYGEKPKKKRRDYYYAFLEQVVQNFGKKIDAGMITLEEGSIEEIALDTLRQSQVDFMKTTATYADGTLVEADDGSAITRGQHLRSMTSNPVDEAIKAALNGGSGSSALTNAVGKLRKREKFRVIYWRQHMDKPSVQKYCKIILKKYINDEMVRVSDQFSRLLETDKRGISNFASILFASRPTHTLDPSIEDPATGETGNAGSLWMWGSMQASGHAGFPDGPWPVPRMYPDGPLETYINYTRRYLNDAEAAEPTLDTSEYFSKKKYYWPFLFEKYVRFRLKTETDEDGNVIVKTPAGILNALKADHLIPLTLAPYINYDEIIGTSPLGSLPTPEIKAAAEEYVEGGVINVAEFGDHVVTYTELAADHGGYEGNKFQDLFDDFFAGIRICFIPPYDMLEQESTITPVDDPGTAPSTPSPAAAGVTTKVLKDYEITKSIGEAFSPADRIRHRAFYYTDGASERPKAPTRSIPIVSAEKSYKGKDAYTEFAEPEGLGTLNWFKPGMIDCMIAELTMKAEYKTLFEYCLSFARFNSIWATYTINAFLPSIGSADPEYKKVNTIGGPKWKDRDEIDDPDIDEPTGDPSNADEFGGVGTGNDGWIAKPTEAGGGKPVTFTPGFRGWDRKTFNRSKKFARILFNTSYKGSDNEYENDKGGAKADRKSLRPTTNLDLGFGWLFKRRQVPKPPEECD